MALASRSDLAHDRISGSVNGLAGLLIVTSLLVITAKRPVASALFYALQSLVLVAVFVTLAGVTGSPSSSANRRWTNRNAKTTSDPNPTSQAPKEPKAHSADKGDQLDLHQHVTR